MIKLRALEEAFARIHAEDHAIEPPLVALGVDRGITEIGFGLRQHGIDVLDAIARVWMRGQPLGQFAAALGFELVEHLHDVDHLTRVVVRTARVADAERVSLVLVVT